MKTVFITGADRGIGYAMCEIFLQNGWKVIAGKLMDRVDYLEKLKKENENLFIVPLDVSSPDSIDDAVRKTAEITDSLDMLINVAGIFKGDSPEDIRALIHVNTVGPINVTKAFLPIMENGMKRICFFSSEAGSVSLAHRKNAYGYGMSKAALNMAVKLMFNTLSKEGFTFRLYHPGWVNTYMEGDEKKNIAPYEASDTAKTAYKAFTTDRKTESVLQMTDICDQTWSL